MNNAMIAIDIGASSGRHMLGQVKNGRLELTELYRFSNGAQRKNGRLCWDIDRLFAEILNGLRTARAQGITPRSVAIDTWGVDFVLLDAQGRMLGDAVSYRDGRTQGMDEIVRRVIDEEALYARTGIQKQPFNTIYQLTALREAGELDAAQEMLLLPEYLNYLLTGQRVHEYTNASTTGLLDARARDWDWELIDRCGFPRRLFGLLSQPGTRVGALLLEIAQAVGFDTQILLAPTHDTAAAVMAAPLEASDAYLSSGTWSLLGMELPAPILTPESRARNLTNEGGAQGTIRYLKNIMGLWMLQELRRELCPQTSFAELAALAERHDGYPGRVDCNAVRFLAPVSMAAELRSALAEGGYPAPADVGDLTACVCHSLADCYRAAVDELEALTGRRIACLRVVGGGCRNDYLNRLTARALARPLTAGPAEATAIGNLLSQLLHAGEIHTLAEGRALVRASFTLKAYA